MDSHIKEGGIEEVRRFAAQISLCLGLKEVEVLVDRESTYISAGPDDHAGSPPPWSDPMANRKLTVLRHGPDLDQLTISLRASGDLQETACAMWRALFSTFEWNAALNDHAHVQRRPPLTITDVELWIALGFEFGTEDGEFVLTRNTRIPAGVPDGDQTRMRAIASHLAAQLEVETAVYQVGEEVLEEIVAA